MSIYDIRNILGKSLQDCHQLTEMFVSQSLFQKIHPNFFELTLEILEQLKLFIKKEAHDEKEAHDSKAHDEKTQDEAHDNVANDEAHDNQLQKKLSETELQILELCTNPKKTSDLLNLLGYSTRTGNFKSALRHLLKNNLIQMTIPESPRSKN